MPVIKKYNNNKYNFSGELASIFKVAEKDLCHLDRLRPDLMPSLPLNSLIETRTNFHELVYSAIRSQQGSCLKEIYKNFISDIVAPLFDDSFLYQKFPTFRIQLPGKQAIHNWHYDSDENHQHPEWEITFQIAVTDMLDSRATWIESVPGLKDFTPMEMIKGEFAIFDGNRCLHGNKVNSSDLCRISLDFRILPAQRYSAPSSNLALTAGLRFVIGEYYAYFQK